MFEPDLEPILLEVATTLGGEHDLPGLAGRLFSAMSALPAVRLGGLSVYDEEREAVDRYTVARKANGALRAEGTSAKTPSVVHEETSLEDGEVPLFRDSVEVQVSPDLRVDRPQPLYERLRDQGVQRYVSAPMELNGKLLGAVYVGFTSPEPVRESVRLFMGRLGRIATPMLWNCLTRARFARGDRRRSTLIDLAKVINSSLKVEAVIDSVRPVIAQLSDVCLCQINVLGEDAQTFTSYQYVKASDGAVSVPQRPGVAATSSTAMERLVRDRKTYKSDDLERRTAFDADVELRAAGVRRYVLAPMVVRGRFLGGLLVGMTDPHPVRKVDQWLCENIGLQLGLAISNAMQHEQLTQLSNRLREHNVYLREEIQSQHGFGEMIGKSEAMQRLYEDIARVANTDASVLITGETGVGKELAARAIHARSARADRPLVKVNCPAIPEGMAESELFGHERGAFTSAVARRVGRFELACDGTLFLDEIGELSLAMQAKLLRVLQDHEFERVGGTKTLVSDARIIAATNRNLDVALKRGTFRSDLYFRLNVFPLEIPSLAQRREDIPLLVEEFVGRASRRIGKRIDQIDPASMAYLSEREWPGNVRELQHVLERAVILCDGPCLHVEEAEAPPRAAEAGQTPEPGGSVPTLKDLEAEHIRRVLEQTGGVIEGPEGAAIVLEIKPSTLRYRMGRLGVQRPARRA